MTGVQTCALPILLYTPPRTQNGNCKLPPKSCSCCRHKIDTLIDLGEDECLEGTTERSDGNRVRSARIGEVRTMCLEFSCKRAQSRTCSGYAERSRKSQRRGTTPKDWFPVTHSDTKILLLFHQSQTNVIAFFLSAQSVIFPFAIFTLLLFRKF